MEISFNHSQIPYTNIWISLQIWLLYQNSLKNRPRTRYTVHVKWYSLFCNGAWNRSAKAAFNSNWNHIIGSMANVSRTNNDKIYPKLIAINRNHFPSLILLGTRLSALNDTHHIHTDAVLDGRNTDALKVNSVSCPSDSVTDGRNNLNLLSQWTVVPRYFS